MAAVWRYHLDLCGGAMHLLLPPAIIGLGDARDIAASVGFESALLVGQHIGKLVMIVGRDYEHPFPLNGLSVGL